MQETKKICRRCLLAERSEDEYVRSLKEYIAGYPEDKRVCEEEYRRRLGICTDCERLADGICSLCGCYVELRALKPNSVCPEPFDNKWKVDKC